MSTSDMLHADVTEKIIQAIFEVQTSLGYGFLEKVYENALVFELRQLGWDVEQQKNIKVYYKGEVVGDYFADLLVNDKVIVELKSGKGLVPEHEAQLLNYLRSSHVEVGLLVNFGTRVTFKRKVLGNEYKKDYLG